MKRASVNATASGNTQILPAQGVGQRIRILSAVMVTDAISVIKFQSSTTDISAGLPFSANGGVVIGPNEHGWFETAENEALNLNLSLTANVGCSITYILVP